MDLTVIERVKPLLKIKATTTTHDQLLRQFITGVSSQVERFLDRHLERKARTEVYSLRPGQAVVQLRGYPVSSSPAPAFKNAYDQDFSGDAIDDDLYYVDLQSGRDSTGHLRFTGRYAPVSGEGVLQAVYTGGMGEGRIGVRMIATIGTITGTMTVGNTVVGGTSGARGLIVARTSGVSITVDVYSGVFEAGETLTDVTASGSCTMSAISTSPLVHDFPDVVMAAELQLAHLWQRRDTVGAVSVSGENGSISLENPGFELLPGVRSMLSQYRSQGA